MMLFLLLYSIYSIEYQQFITNFTVNDLLNFGPH
jgi:hypothetical protein